MKLTRKLIPAFAMLLVSAVLMSTASFAWFSMNQTVTATGISVTAQAPESLMISAKSATEGFGATVQLTNQNTSMGAQIVPVTPYKTGTTQLADDSAVAFYKLKDAAAATVNENGELTGGAASADVTNSTYYEATTADFYKTQLWVKLDGTTTEKQLKVAASWATEPTTAIKGAFHVLFVSGNEVLLDLDMTNAGTATDLVEITGGANATEITVYVYVYGRDEHCTNANISANATAGITLTFSYAAIPTDT